LFSVFSTTFLIIKNLNDYYSSRLASVASPLSSGIGPELSTGLSSLSATVGLGEDIAEEEEEIDELEEEVEEPEEDIVEFEEEIVEPEERDDRLEGELV
jgi:hypothetical protein